MNQLAQNLVPVAMSLGLVAVCLYDKWLPLLSKLKFWTLRKRTPVTPKRADIFYYWNGLYDRAKPCCKEKLEILLPALLRDEEESEH